MADVGQSVCSPPIAIHCECGWKALLEDSGAISWWRRWSDTNCTYVPIESPL